jgi:KDO2-lipid IV(A) lauroyltransferase
VSAPPRGPGESDPGGEAAAAPPASGGRARSAAEPSLRDRAEYLGYRLGGALVRRLPAGALRAVAERAASRLFARNGKRVRWTLANLRIAFPELSEPERREIGRQSYVNFGWNLIDYLRAETWTDDDYRERIVLRGLEHARAALAHGRGAILLTLHMGNFELAAHILPLHGIEFATVGRRMRNPLLWGRVVEGRTQRAGELIERRGAARGMLRALRQGHLVGVLNDQYSRRRRGVMVPLFGKRCSTTAGVATIALRTGAPVIPGYVTRAGSDRHVAVFEPPLEIPLTGDRSSDIEVATAHYNLALEAIIRRHPEQWMWGHRRFRHSPDLDYDPYAAG